MLLSRLESSKLLSDAATRLETLLVNLDKRAEYVLSFWPAVIFAGLPWWRIPDGSFFGYLQLLGNRKFYRFRILDLMNMFRVRLSLIARRCRVSIETFGVNVIAR